MDNCCFNRPFDDQTQIRVRLETEAKLEVQRRIKVGELKLAWSYILDYENSANPFEVRREAIAGWKGVASIDVAETPDLLQFAEQITRLSVPAKDAIHIASAIVAGCTFFLTTDDRIISKMKGYAGISVMNPAQFVTEAQP
jgi:hypothetical protein